MKITKKETEFGIDVFLEENNKTLSIMFCGNLDLYWTLYSSDIDEDNEFIITKENFEVYHLFENLYNDIKNVDIYGENQLPVYIKTRKEKKLYYGDRYNDIERKKKLYKKQGFANYNSLFNAKEKTITWYSDETNHKVANYLQIIKQKNSYKIVFNHQKQMDMYDRDFCTKRSISVRFRNSGSSYEPFNIVFMRMYKNIQKVDDANEKGHQIDIEEYLYNKIRTRKRSISKR